MIPMALHALFKPKDKADLLKRIEQGEPLLRKGQPLPLAEPPATPNRISMLFPASPGVSMAGALGHPYGAGKRPASNWEIDALLEGEGWRAVQDVFPCWTGTLAVYVEPGQSFREAADMTAQPSISCFDDKEKIMYSFPLPEELLDKRDTVIIVPHEIFNKFDFYPGLCLINWSHAIIIGGFPRSNGWYLPSLDYGIPCGDEVDPSTPKARFLGRSPGKYIGLIARRCSNVWNDYDRRVVDLLYASSDAFGVAVFDEGDSP